MVKPPPFSQEEGKILLQLARESLENKLLHRGHDLLRLHRAPFDGFFGCFVTLTINKRLRGCIGQIEGDLSLFEAVSAYAVKSALQDPRFEPLSAEELKETKLEISVLTAPEEIKGENKEERLTQIRPFIDGVVIEQGGRRATFLPQVWDSLKEKELFLNELCKKAGLPAQAWEKERMTFLTYQVQSFNQED